MEICSCCGKEITEGETLYVNREWKLRGFRFCKDCVTSTRAKQWVAKQPTKGGYVDRAKNILLKTNPTDEDVYSLAGVLEKADKYDVIKAEEKT